MRLYNDHNADFDVAENICDVWVTPVRTQDIYRTRARRRAIRTSEAATSGGTYTVRDSVFTFLKCEQEVPLRIGSLIYTQDREELWHVFEVNQTFHRTRYQCVTRKGFLQEDMTDLAVIETNLGEKDAYGAPKKKWHTLLQNHPVKFQETGNEVASGEDRNMIQRTGQIYLETSQDLQAGIRVKIGKTYWNVTGVTGKGEIGLVQVLDVVEARTPGV